MTAETLRGNTRAMDAAKDTDTPPQAYVASIYDVLSEMALYVSAALIVMGITQPSIWKPNTFGFGGNEYNLFGIVQTLFESGLGFLGLVVIIFSGVFPIAKTLTAAIIFRQGAQPSARLTFLLNILGKWSMLDVFLAAILVGLSQISIYIGFEARAGLYLFTAGVVLNNIATLRLSFSRIGKDAI